jgi:hypothetical protein
MNNLDSYMNQKYRPLEEIRREHPKIEAEHLAGRFPEGIVDNLRYVLQQFGSDPDHCALVQPAGGQLWLLVCGQIQQLLSAPTRARPKRICAICWMLFAGFTPARSTRTPFCTAQHHGLIDYDERMAVLLQRVRGQAVRPLLHALHRRGWL